MESKLTLYRKYRPSTFEEVVGQEHVTTTIRNALKSGNVSHAYLFSGPRGTGKTTVARLIAKALNCTQGPTPEPCGVCPNCTAIQAGTFMDVIEIDAASNRGIDDIRELRDHIYFSPSQGRYRVFIIDEVHMLTQDASNALLKTLEEPPEHAVFVLATTEKHRVLPTIQSRCQVFDFRKIPVPVIVERLKEVIKREKLKADERALNIIARKSRGALRDALVLLEQVRTYADNEITPDAVIRLVGLIPEEKLAELMKNIITGDITSSVKIIRELDSRGYEIKGLISSLEHFVVDYTVYKASGFFNPDSILDREILDELVSLDEKFDLHILLDELENASQKIRRGEDPLLALETALIKFFRDARSSASEIKPDGLRSYSGLLVIEENRNLAGNTEPAKPKSTEDVWSDFLEFFKKKKKIALHSRLKSAFPLEISDDRVRLAFPVGFEDSAAEINKKANREFIEEALRQFFKRENIELVVEGFENEIKEDYGEEISGKKPEEMIIEEAASEVKENQVNPGQLLLEKLGAELIEKRTLTADADSQTNDS